MSKEKVRDASDGEPQGDIWLDMQIEPKQVLVQQQAIITIRIYQAVSLSQAQISEPAPAHAIVERLGEDSTFQTTKNGRRWHVTERRYALFPQQSGQLEIEPLQLDGSVMVGNGGYFQSAKPVRVRSNALNLDVRAIPTSWNAAEWLPAKQIRLEESWPESIEHKVGEPITRTLTVYADGLTSSQLPVFFTALPDFLKAYPDTPVLSDDKKASGIIGSRQEKTAIMPTRPGTYIWPELSLSWWNTETGKLEEASIPARTFKVIADASANVSQPVDPAAAEHLQVADVKPASTT
ncbi:MAG: protein BatD, partial [Mariprofundus sp.]